jgi:hypothetical protein
MSAQSPVRSGTRQKYELTIERCAELGRALETIGLCMFDLEVPFDADGTVPVELEITTYRPRGSSTGNTTTSG